MLTTKALSGRACVDVRGTASALTRLGLPLPPIMLQVAFRVQNIIRETNDVTCHHSIGGSCWQARICSAFGASSRIPGASTGGSMSTSRTDSSPLLFVELIVVGRCLECQCRNSTAIKCFSSMTTIVLNTTLNAFVPLATSPISLNSFLYALI